MPRFRDENDINSLFGLAGEQLDLPDGVVEKDYWVAQALRALQRAYPDEFIFKGGTSLSKGFALIQRFSEDIDILVRDKPGSSHNQRYKRLRKMVATAAAEVSGGKSNTVTVHNKGEFRIEELSYGPETDGPSFMLPIIRLDIGIIGGIEPHGSRTIGTLLGDVLAAARGIDVGAFDDLAPFEVPVLHPGRTLMEKVMHVHTLSVRNVATPQALQGLRAARHFYDIYCLLGHEESCELLADRDAFEEVLADAEAISTQHFKGVEPRPADGYAASQAFTGPTRLKEFWQEEYATTLEGYYFGAGDHPSFDEVCERVQAQRELL